MENFNNFQDLLEGNLTDLEEKELYSILSTDSNIRTEFKSMLTFQKAMDNSKVFSMIPVESEKAIFNSLAFGGSSTLSASSAMLTSTGIVLKYIGIASLGAMISALVFFGFADKFGYTKNNIQSNKFISESNDTKHELLSNTVGISSSNQGATFKHLDVEHIQKRKISEQPDKLLIKEKVIKIDNMKNQNSVINISEPLVQFTNNSTVKVKYELTPIIENSSSLKVPFENKNSVGVITELQSMQNWFDTQTKAVPDKIAPFHNMMVSVYYEPVDNWAIGFNLRNETFYEDFSGKDEIGQQTWIEQQPNFTTYSLILKYNSQYEIISQLKPNFSISYGFNGAGNVARLGAGVRYEYNDVIAFLLGFEYSGMLYKYQNTNFLTNKYAINYGISFKIK
jgi:hypothetical protein